MDACFNWHSALHIKLCLENRCSSKYYVKSKCDIKLFNINRYTVNFVVTKIFETDDKQLMMAD